MNDQPTRAADVALDETAASLDESHPLNARMRENGIGLVPRVFEINTEEKYATLGAGAIESLFSLPFGWHAIDDGRRTLLFDANGRMQVNLDLRACHHGPEALLQNILNQHLTEQPEIEHMLLELDNMLCLGMRNYRVEGELLEQAFLVKDISRPGLVLVARITAAPEDMVLAMNLAEVVLRDLTSVRSDA